MDLEKIKEKPLFQLTVGEFMIVQNRANMATKETENKSYTDTKDSKRYIYGIRGIAKLFGCSISSANRLKKSGVIDKAIIQNGRKIIVDSELALKLVKESK